MAEGLVDAVVRGWRDPRGAMAQEADRGLSEARALVHLMLACGLFFVASLPNAVREARALAIDDPVEGAVSAHLFGYLALAPLLAYGVAGLVHLVARGFGGRGGFLAARAALFWSLLLVAPLVLLLSLLGVAAEAAVAVLLPFTTLLGYAVLAVWVWLFAASLAEAEGFSATGKVAAVVAAAFAGIAGLLGLVASGGA
jgi:hypothetical protein